MAKRTDTGSYPVDAVPTPTTALLAIDIDEDEAGGFGVLTTKDALKDQHFTKYLPLPPGLPLKGRFAGYGGEELVEDQNRKGRKRRIHTWLVKVSNVLTYRIPSSSQLTRQLPHYPIGDVITIVQMVDKVRSKKGNQVNDFMVSDPTSGWLRDPHVQLAELDAELGEVA